MEKSHVFHVHQVIKVNVNETNVHDAPFFFIQLCINFILIDWPSTLLLKLSSFLPLLFSILLFLEDFLNITIQIY